MSLYKSGLPIEMVYTSYRTELERLEALAKP
jgi:hypothetical protein